MDISSTMLSSLRSSGLVVFEAMSRPSSDSATALPPADNAIVFQALPKKITASVPSVTPAKQFADPKS